MDPHDLPPNSRRAGQMPQEILEAAQAKEKAEAKPKGEAKSSDKSADKNAN